jgi:DNA-binding NtrC family response regulator
MTEPFRVLIVDDDVNMGRTLADIVSASGYDVETAQSAEEGLERLAALPFHCVVSDIVMPGMNGVAFQKKILELYGPIPILLITAYASRDLITKARDQGVLAFLEKPLNIPVLLSFLRTIAEGNYGSPRPGFYAGRFTT